MSAATAGSRWWSVSADSVSEGARGVARRVRTIAEAVISSSRGWKLPLRNAAACSPWVASSGTGFATRSTSARRRGTSEARSPRSGAYVAPSETEASSAGGTTVVLAPEPATGSSLAITRRRKSRDVSSTRESRRRVARRALAPSRVSRAAPRRPLGPADALDSALAAPPAANILTAPACSAANDEARSRARVPSARCREGREIRVRATLLTGNRRSSAFATLIGGEGAGEKSPRFRSVSDAREGDSGLIVDGRSRDHRWAFARRKRTSTGSIGPARVPTDDKSVPIGERRTGRAIGENVRFGCTAKHRNALPRASASTDAPSLRRSTREGARRRADVANDAPDA